ncbi:hypothetical protein SELMODRAFT_424029 [Selaginella moellendorffii]|uniref:Uncharacterized protein n=1 Tax=Selaginella moellendorffii TaxID=88036 RepID=D8SNK3_SELML|nr:hypothetical protein SELMODRAFT_424029 [Selaginella moellendorffii]
METEASLPPPGACSKNRADLWNAIRSQFGIASALPENGARGQTTLPLSIMNACTGPVDLHTTRLIHSNVEESFATSGSPENGAQIRNALVSEKWLLPSLWSPWRPRNGSFQACGRHGDQDSSLRSLILSRVKFEVGIAGGGSRIKIERHEGALYSVPCVYVEQDAVVEISKISSSSGDAIEIRIK